MNAADKVEILKGAAANLYGSGAMGGVVNVFGHLPDKLEVKAGVSGGFYDAPPSSDQSDYRKPAGTTTSSIGTPWFWNTYIGLGNKSGKWNYNLLYTHSNDEGYRENSYNKLDDIKLKARYDINAKQYILLSAFYNETNGGYALTWPYDATVITSAFDPHPEFAYDVYVNARYWTYDTAYPVALAATIADLISLYHMTPAVAAAAAPAIADPIAKGMSALQKYDVYTDDVIKRKNALVGLNYVNLLRDNLSLDTRLYYTHNGTIYDYNLTSSDQTYATLRVRTPGEFNETYSDRFGAGTKLDWRVSDSHRLLFGLDGNITEVNSTQVAAELPIKNTLQGIQEKNAAIFIQDEWKITNKLTSLISLRYDWSGIDANDVEITAGHPLPIENKSVDAINPRIALNYKAMDDMSFRASWGTSFRAPTLYERFIRDAGFLTGTPNPALDKESMTAYEVGMFKQFGDKVSFDIAGFINDYEDLIESAKIGYTSFQFKNITKARIWGIETGLNYRPSSKWALNAVYTYMNAKNTDYKPSTPPSSNDLNPDPSWLPMRPEHTASASVTFKPVSQLALNFNGRYVGKYKAVNFYTNTAGLNYPGDFIVLNAGVKYQAAETVSLNVTCRNIGNVQYEEAEWFRAPGRSYVAGMDFTF
jgi:iron complex outermembrane recepter protein